MTHKYFYLSRPPSYAHQPDGFSNRDGGCPSRNWPTAAVGNGGKIWAFGWVEYPEPLTFETCFKWDLRPDNQIECAHYDFWIDNNRNQADADWSESEHIQYYLSGDMDQDHHMYEITKVLADARGK
jgi:hypothetical protein